MPKFTHDELMQLFHAVSEYVENHDDPDAVPAPALIAREKLDEYVIALGEARHGS